MPRAVVLLSGGLDSTTVLAVAHDLGFEVWALTITYGQRHDVEVEAACRVAQLYGARHHEIVAIPLSQFGGSALTDDIDVPKSPFVGQDLSCHPQHSTRQDLSCQPQPSARQDESRHPQHSTRQDESRHPLHSTRQDESRHPQPSTRQDSSCQPQHSTRQDESCQPQPSARQDLSCHSQHSTRQDESCPTHGDGIPVTYVPARNTVFLSLALAYAETLGANDIFIGVSSVDYSGYPDCRPEFIEAFQSLARKATKAGVEGQQITIHAPLLHLSKPQTIQLGLKLGVDYGLTHSCYDPINGKPCNRCDSCRIRQSAFQFLGMRDPLISQLD